MKLIFHVDYRTEWGQSVYICGNTPALGNGNPAKALRMTISDSEHWSAEVEVPDTLKQLDYSYIVKDDKQIIRKEWGEPRQLMPAKNAPCVIYDHWQEQPSDKPYYSSAFTECICKRSDKSRRTAPRKGYVRICVSAPMIGRDQTLALCGSAKSIGQWQTDKAVRMSDANYPVWTADIPAKTVTPDTEYKFIVIDSATGNVVAWEGGVNRRIGIMPDESCATVVDGLRLVSPLAPWKGAGTAIPVFSLRSERDFGAGDF